MKKKLGIVGAVVFALTMLFNTTNFEIKGEQDVALSSIFTLNTANAETGGSDCGIYTCITIPSSWSVNEYIDNNGQTCSETILTLEETICSDGCFYNSFGGETIIYDSDC